MITSEPGDVVPSNNAHASSYKTAAARTSWSLALALLISAASPSCLRTLACVPIHPFVAEAMQNTDSDGNGSAPVVVATTLLTAAIGVGAVLYNRSNVDLKLGDLLGVLRLVVKGSGTCSPLWF